MFDIGPGVLHWQRDTPGMALVQGAIRGIAHDEERGLICYIKVEHAHYVGMLQASNGACLVAEALYLLVVSCLSSTWMLL